MKLLCLEAVSAPHHWERPALGLSAHGSEIHPSSGPSPLTVSAVASIMTLMVGFFPLSGVSQTLAHTPYADFEALSFFCQEQVPVAAGTLYN